MGEKSVLPTRDFHTNTFRDLVIVLDKECPGIRDLLAGSAFDIAHLQQARAETPVGDGVQDPVRDVFLKYSLLVLV